MSSWPCRQEETLPNNNSLKHPSESNPSNQAKRRCPSHLGVSPFQPLLNTIYESPSLPLPPLPQFIPTFTAPSPGPPPSPKKNLKHRRSLSETKAFATPNSSWYMATFEVGEKLGSGHYGDVFKCRHKLDGADYAVKILKLNYQGTKHRELLLNEVYELARCESRYIVRYFNSWEESERLYIQTEYCEKGNLSQYIENIFTEKELLRLMKHIAKGLKHLHCRAKVHLDIKPDNIFIKRNEPNTSNVIYKIGDFGLVSSSSLKKGFPQEGDAKYLAREILQENDKASLKKGDIFSLGATVYEMASRTRLVSQGEEFHALRNGVFRKSNEYSDDFWNLLERLLHSDQNERPTANDLLQLIGNILAKSKTYEQDKLML